ncbi:peptidase M61 [Novosphingobium sp. ZN18A2]|uniref:M61 family metallopeptidase n=1 Tax=Novosphingobium sp. ZN18A2 TaxID=3079861 RepID=UPI0030CFCFBC
MPKILAVAPLFLALSVSTPALAQAQDAAARSMPVATPIQYRVPDPQNVPYAGTIALDIDATDVTRGVYRVTETIPVAAGTDAITLLLPAWLPGNHAARGPINLLADVRFFVDGKPVVWERDPIDVRAFHVSLPKGTTSLVARFVHTSPLTGREGRITMTREMLNLQWEKMSLYPAGHYTRLITFKPTVAFPNDWTVFTALDGKAQSGNRVTWAATDYETLVDSPIFAGKYARRWDIGNGVHLDAVADEARLLAIAPDHLKVYRNLTDQAVRLFGARHFDHYDFLLALTDRMGGIGLEHHRSSENQYEPGTFIDWDRMDWDRNVIAHEFVHSWNGKFRRPAGLWTPAYSVPMQDNLLWVYEGQTQFWGYVLAARSGIQTPQTVLDAFAVTAAKYSEGQPGRAWRSVEDTTFDPIIDGRRPQPYGSLSRNEDYYSEGALVWLEADQIIREGTKGRKGLDDFAKAFFGMRDGDWGELTYTFDDVVKALKGVYPAYDWATFLKTRLYAPGQPAPLKGIEMAGYKLVWKETPNSYEKGRMGHSGNLNLFYSLGVDLNGNGTVVSTRWDGPAFNAGLVNGARIVAVNGEKYSKDRMTRAITAAKGGKTQIDLLVQRGDRFLTVPVDWHGGLRYPWLEKAVKGTAPLDRLMAPRR